MSAPDAGSAAAVTKPGNCDRIVFIGKDKHVIKHSWRIHSVPGKVRLVTKLIDNRHRNRPSNTVQAVVTNTEEALSSKAAEMARSILQHKRDQFLKVQQGWAGGRSSSGSAGRRKRSGGDHF